jgi:signal transduction histidine kinase
MIGRNFAEFLKEELTESDLQTHADLIAGKSIYGYETTHVRKNGTLVHLSFNAVPMRDEHGNIIGTMGMATDITERKNLIEQLTQAQKMETVGRLAGGVAHDFNNLLTVIMGFTELAENDISNVQLVQHSLEQVKAATNRAASLTEQLLAFARKQMMRLHTVQINDVLSSLNVMMGRLIPENVLVSLNLSPGLPLVQVDIHQLEQVLINLMVNARDAMPGGGRLSLTTDRVAMDAESAKAIPEMQPGEYVRVSVADTGQGIPSDVRLKIFEPFFTTKELGKGTGLGLSVCEGILRQHGGYIQVESEIGKGTTFYLYLPPAS